MTFLTWNYAIFFIFLIIWILTLINYIINKGGIMRHKKITKKTKAQRTTEYDPNSSSQYSKKKIFQASGIYSNTSPIRYHEDVKSTYDPFTSKPF